MRKPFEPLKAMLNCGEAVYLSDANAAIAQDKKEYKIICEHLLRTVEAADGAYLVRDIALREVERLRNILKDLDGNIQGPNRKWAEDLISKALENKE